MEATKKPSIKWFICYSDGTEMRCNSTMRGTWSGYKAYCSCGWSFGEPGLLKPYVAMKVDEHLFDDHHDEWIRRRDARDARFTARCDATRRDYEESKAHFAAVIAQLEAGA